jgi:hypothetical protein
VKLLERFNAEKAKIIEVLEKKNEVLEKEYQDVLDLNMKEYEEAQQKVGENQKAHLTCLKHHLDLFHLCNGKIMDTEEPINHTKLLRVGLWALNLNILSKHFSARASRLYIRPPLSSGDLRRTSGRPSEWRSHRVGIPSGMYFPLGAYRQDLVGSGGIWWDLAKSGGIW